jgi:hypothetical protein
MARRRRHADYNREQNARYRDLPYGIRRPTPVRKVSFTGLDAHPDNPTEAALALHIGREHMAEFHKDARYGEMSVDDINEYVTRMVMFENGR